MKRIINLLTIILLTSLLITSAFGQGFNASGLGMGGAYGALARGVDAFAWNPANLALSHENKLEINLAGVNFNAANSSFSIDDYKRYFTQSGHHGYWTPEDIDKLLDMIPDEGLDINGDVKANAVGLLFDKYGLSVQLIGKTRGLIPKSLYELALKGNQDINKEYSFNDFDGDGFTAVKFSLSLSQPIPFKKYFDEFGVGLNVNYYSGIIVGEVVRSEGIFATTSSAIVSSMDVVSRTGQSGNGLGFDIGAAGKFNDKWSMSLVLNNLFAGIKWHNELKENIATFVVDSITIDNIGELDSLISTTTNPIDEFRTTLPIVAHLGLAYHYLDNLTFTLDLEQAFEEKMGYSDRGQIAAGVQYSPIKYIPLRAGFSVGGKWKYLFGLGMGIHVGFFHIDLAYAMHQGMWPTKTTGFSTAANIKLVF